MRDLHENLAAASSAVNPGPHQLLREELDMFERMTKAKPGRQVRYDRSLAIIRALADGRCDALHLVGFAISALLRSACVDASASGDEMAKKIEDMRWSWLSILILARRVRMDRQDKGTGHANR